MSAVHYLIETNQIHKARRLYPSVSKECVLWQDGYLKNDLYNLMSLNSIRLGRKQECVMLFQEQLHSSFDNRYKKYECSYKLAKLLYSNRHYKSLILDAIDTRLKLPENHLYSSLHHHVCALTIAGLGNYKKAFSMLQDTKLIFLKRGSFSETLSVEYNIAQIYITTNEYDKCEFLLENQVRKYGYSIHNLKLLITAKLFLRKFEDVQHLIKNDLLQLFHNNLDILSQLYITLYNHFNRQRLTCSFGEVNIALSYVIALQKDLKEIFGIMQNRRTTKGFFV